LSRKNRLSKVNERNAASEASAETPAPTPSISAWKASLTDALASSPADDEPGHEPQVTQPRGDREHMRELAHLDSTAHLVARRRDGPVRAIRLPMLPEMQASTLGGVEAWSMRSSGASSESSETPARHHRSALSARRRYGPGKGSAYEHR